MKPDEVKRILQGTARDILTGTSGLGDPAGTGWDKATAFGLVDAYAAWSSIP
ncbi:MAG TPA: hypothetical protein VH500_17095 [Nitrososphaeraceae archaeon]